MEKVSTFIAWQMKGNWQVRLELHSAFKRLLKHILSFSKGHQSNFFQVVNCQLSDRKNGAQKKKTLASKDPSFF